ncbi:MAG TPA: hypothetical protein VMB48_13955 [Steroidobacteraceae bacterium]|nr:hypothetical protein [Steroidobacteraceae bacterium]
MAIGLLARSNEPLLRPALLRCSGYAAGWRSADMHPASIISGAITHTVTTDI